MIMKNQIMKKIPEGYKQTEIGVIPEDWEVVPTSNLGNFSKGQGIRKDESLSGNIPCIRYGEIYTHHNNIVKNYNSWISPIVAKTSRKLKKGDILFAGSGETKEEIGKCVAFISAEEAYAGGDIVILSPTKGDSSFFGYLFNSPIIVSQKSSKGQGDAVVHISASALSTIDIPLPPKPEQTAIATVLSDTDVLIEKLEKLITKKKAIKQGAMQQLLTGKKRLPGFSGKWEVKKLGDIFLILAGGDLIKEYYSQTKDDKYCYPIYSNSLTNKGLYGFSKLYRHDENCVTVTARGTIGVANARDHKFDAIGRVLILRPLCELSCFFVSEYLNNRIAFSIESTGVPQLTAPQISKYEIVFPGYIEQTAIATILSDMDAEIEKLEQKRDKYTMLKQGIMQQLLTGRIRIYANN